MQIEAAVAPAVFELFPGFRRGIILVADLDNRGRPDQLSLALKEAAAKFGTDSADPDDPRLAAWLNAYKKLGVNPNKYPPSILALVKRVRRGQEVPFINPAVAAFNLVSLKHLLPCGGDDVARTSGRLLLGPASGRENFVPLGSGEAEAPAAGEIIYYDPASLDVMCRRWNWRNGDQTKIMPVTKKMVINVDGLHDGAETDVIDARDELASLLRKHAGASLKTDLLSPLRPRAEHTL